MVDGWVFFRTIHQYSPRCRLNLEGILTKEYEPASSLSRVRFYCIPREDDHRSESGHPMVNTPLHNVFYNLHYELFPFSSLSAFSCSRQRLSAVLLSHQINTFVRFVQILAIRLALGFSIGRLVWCRRIIHPFIFTVSSSGHVAGKVAIAMFFSHLLWSQWPARLAFSVFSVTLDRYVLGLNIVWFWWWCVVIWGERPLKPPTHRRMISRVQVGLGRGAFGDGDSALPPNAFRTGI